MGACLNLSQLCTRSVSDGRRASSGSRIRYGDGWAAVRRVYENGDVSVYDEERRILVRLPAAIVKNEAAKAEVRERIHTVIRRQAWREQEAMLTDLRNSRAAVMTPQRRGPSRERRAQSPRRAVRAGSSRDGPGLADPDEPPDLDDLRPLTAEVRAYLKAAIDARRREVLAERPEVSPEDRA
jgi:hypothetical protein